MLLYDHNYGRARMGEARRRATRVRPDRSTDDARGARLAGVQLAAAQVLLRMSERLDARARGDPAHARDA